MLNELKIMLGIAASDLSCDDKLTLLLSTARARLQLLLGGIDPPDTMKHIVLEVAICRFNRIGSEGMASHSVEGESLSFVEDDFAPFEAEIQAFLESQAVTSRGKVRFL